MTIGKWCQFSLIPFSINCETFSSRIVLPGTFVKGRVSFLRSYYALEVLPSSSREQIHSTFGQRKSQGALSLRSLYFSWEHGFLPLSRRILPRGEPPGRKSTCPPPLSRAKAAHFKQPRHQHTNEKKKPATRKCSSGTNFNTSREENR